MQSLLVALIVACAAAYAGWQLMPQTLRRWIVRVVARALPGQSTRLARLEAAAEQGGCGSCKGCAADSNAKPTPKQATIMVHRAGARGQG